MPAPILSVVPGDQSITLSWSVPTGTQGTGGGSEPPGTQELYSGQQHDSSRDTFTEIRIWIAGADYALQYVVWAMTNFDMSAGAAPGTFTITLRDPDRTLDFIGGEFVKLVIDGDTYFGGYVLSVTKGTWFADSVGTQAVSGRKWVLQGVDRNIFFDRTYVYNHANLAAFPTGGGAFPRGRVPHGTTDRQYLIAAIADTDLNLYKPPINFTSRVSDNGPLPFLDPSVDPLHLDHFTFMQSGSSLRAVFADVSSLITAYLPASSMVWYIDQDGFVVYQAQDNVVAPFTVSDDPEAFGDVGIRSLQHTSDISSIKNDVLLFATNLNPDPASKQNTFLYRHNQKNAPPDDSVGRYGRFQYAENVSAFSRAALQARSEKLLFQEGTPAETASFDCFKPGLYPGQIVTINSTPWGYTKRLPIRRISLRFITPSAAVWHVSAAFDTQSPWGLIMALKRPPPRGFIPPRFMPIVAGEDPIAVDPYTFISEQPVSLGNLVYQCSYAYVRYSIAVHAGGLRLISTDGTGGSQLIFNETSPELGRFRLTAAPTGPVYASYHVANNL